MKALKTFIKNIILIHYRALLKIEIFVGRLFFKRNSEVGKVLFAAPVGRDGKDNYITYIRAFKEVPCDFMLFSFDETTFEEREFDNIKIVKAKGLKWDFAYQYLTPDICKDYDYICYWDDDLELVNFSVSQFIAIMKENHLSVAQPALTKESYHSHPITLQNDSHPSGRYTNFVEIMCPVYSQKAWVHLWKMMERMPMGEGLGYDLISWPPFFMRGIIDSQLVRHTREIREKSQKSQAEHDVFKQKYTSFPMKRMEFVNLASLV